MYSRQWRYSKVEGTPDHATHESSAEEGVQQGGECVLVRAAADQKSESV
jgi:hypothetical protein